MLALTLPHKTWAHGLPAGSKLLVLALVTLVLFPVQRLDVLSVALLAVIGLYLSLGRQASRFGLQLLRPLAWMLGLILLYHFVTGQAEVGVRVSLRLLAMIGLANFVTMTSRLDDMIAVVQWLLRPLAALGVNTRVIGVAIAMVIRFAPALGQKGAALLESWRARSPRRAGWRIVIPLCLLALDDADHVAEALRARGGIASGRNGHKRKPAFQSRED
jgi:biotin transport system permease protein